MDRRGIFGDRRATERREPTPFRPANDERRSGRDRRADERRTDLGDRRSRDEERHQRAVHRAPLVAAPAIEAPTVVDRATGLPPISRLIPAAIVVLVSLIDLFVSEASADSRWGLIVVAAGIPIAAFALAAPRRWRWHLAALWFA